MSIESELTRLQNAKSSLKSSIEAKGVTVASDATLDAYPALVDSIPSGGGSSTGAVRFIDYDGTILHTYTPEQFAALESMPANPVHSDLTSQGWNWSLAAAKTYVAANGALDIGQMYAANNPDGKTRLYITIDDISRPTMSLYFGASVDGGVTIDWGDDSPTEQSSGTSDNGYYHDYSSVGDFIITLTVTSGVLTLTGSSSVNIVCPSSTYRYNRARLKKVILGSGITSIGTSAFQTCSSLTTITLPSSLTSIGKSAFQNCYSLTSITLPSSLTSIGTSAFNSCSSLTSITLPSSLTSIDASAFRCCYSLTPITLPSSLTSIGANTFDSCYSLTSINLPSSLTSIGASAFNYCYSLTSITLPSSLTSIGKSAFQNCYGIKYYYVNSTNPPTLGSSALQMQSDSIIYVPAASVDEYKGATDWFAYSSYIQAMP